MVLAGEEIKINVVQERREAGQDVGFFDDGKALIGTQTQVTVTRLLHTGAGKLVFAFSNHAGP